MYSRFTIEQLEFERSDRRLSRCASIGSAMLAGTGIVAGFEGEPVGWLAAGAGIVLSLQYLKQAEDSTAYIAQHTD